MQNTAEQSTTNQIKRSEKTVPQWFFIIFVLVTGAAVMMLEFAASRIMAPWFGTSQFVWGNIIGVVLIALSLGYYVGGRLADKAPQANRLFSIILGAGIFSACIPLFVEFLTRRVSIIEYFYASSGTEGANILAIILGSFAVIVLLMAVPIFLLGMVSPFVIRLATTEVEKAGSVAGRLYAASTVGSIVGTFASSFFFIPYFGSRETVLLSAITLILVAVIGKMFAGTRWLLAAPWIALPLLVYSAFTGTYLRTVGDVVYEEETQYQFVQVVEGSDRFALVYNEGLGTQSYFMKEGVLTGAYYDYIGLLPTVVASSLNEATQDAASTELLILGLAGGTLSRQWATYYPDANVTGVEIDPAIIDIAKNYFALDQQQNLTPLAADARPFLRSTENTYDMIVIDAYTHEFQIPWHLVTQEFFTELHAALNEHGVIAMNIGTNGLDNPLFSSIVHTAQTVFTNASVMHIPNSGNYTLVLSNEALNLASLDAIAEDTSNERADIAAYTQQYLQPYSLDEAAEADAFVLSDNRAPVEVLTERMLLRAIFL